MCSVHSRQTGSIQLRAAPEHQHPPRLQRGSPPLLPCQAVCTPRLGLDPAPLHLSQALQLSSSLNLTAISAQTEAVEGSRVEPGGRDGA
eukprot:448880-Rhodomonas_salina.2